MTLSKWKPALLVAAVTLVLSASIVFVLNAQQAGPAGRGGSGASLFTAVDADNNGTVSREELKAVFAKWLSDSGSDSLTEEQLTAALAAALPAPAMPAGFGGRGATTQNQTPDPGDVEKMMAALPDRAYAEPKQPRRVLVLSKCAGFVHSCIPLAARTIEELGKKTGAWSTVITYDPATINEENLKQFDLVFLNNTTGAFLDDPNDPAASAARKKALIDFVRSGKGLAGIHAATDSYHEQERAAQPPTAAAPRAATPAGGGMNRMLGATLARQMFAAGDKDTNNSLNAAELEALADDWFNKLDPERTDSVLQTDFAARFASEVPQPARAPRAAGAGARAVPQGRDTQVGTWPDFNKMIGGFFKWHWNDPQLITVKIDDPDSPLTQMFDRAPFDINDETYTFGMNVWSRENLRVLTSVDYDKMSDEDKALEAYPRSDHDYGLSWIRREGAGRVFYEAHGHSERVYAMKHMLEHLLAGTQYALGDLEAVDDPSVNPTN